MNKTLIIIHREFTTRVRKKSFLLVTLLVPILFTLLYAFLAWILLRDDHQERDILVINQSTLDQPFTPDRGTRYTYIDDMPPADRERALRDGTCNAIVHLPADLVEHPEITIYSLSQVPLELKNDLAARARAAIERTKRAAIIARAGLPDLEHQLAATATPVTARTLVVSASPAGTTREGSAEIASIIGLVAGFVIYIFIFMYASQVMKGVIEEKSSRVIEVLVSSVKPFQFLLGKITGVAAVGLLQFLIWVAFGTLLLLAAGAFLLPGLDIESLRQATDPGLLAGNTGLDPSQLAVIQNIAKTIDPAAIARFLALFLFYFTGGYLLYASLFAAIGSACDSETDSQQFMLPLTIILVVALYIGIAAMKDPSTPLVFWSSLVPFTSPVVMLVRVPFGVPAWEIITSMTLLVAAFLFFTWLSGKIYRVGILMHGKKITWKELYKWLKY
jgi:ABC-2 type transport system permease protein